MWQPYYTNDNAELLQYIFKAAQIECEARMEMFHRERAYIGEFKTKYKYLSITEIHSLPYDFLMSYVSYIDEIKKIRDKFAREYKNYFNGLWC